MRRAHNALDLVGQRFGRLTVIAKHPVKIYNSCTAWDCRCDCGKAVVSITGNLRSGNTTSCGCWDVEKAVQRNRDRAKHGMCKHPLFKTWDTMIRRCYNPRSQMFNLYGARGVKVCDRWRKSINDFIADMGPKPSPKHSLDRIDTMGDYEPGNCRWADGRQQNNNRRNTIVVTAFSRTQTIRGWANETGIPHRIIYQRLFRDKQTPEEAVTP